MNIILCGALGTMGRVVAAAAEAQHVTVVAGVDREASSALPFPVYAEFAQCPKADAIIDFSHPAMLPALLDYATASHTPAVIATTGMSESDTAAIRAAAEKTPVFFTFNMSLGVNLLVALAKTATAVLGEGFDIELIEQHHNKKIDAPSGTAVMLVNAIADVTPYTPEFIYERHSVRQRRDPRDIGIHSVRGGTIVGEHQVIFAGNDEIVTLSHSARSKNVFAVGALKASHFLAGQPDGLYDMNDLLAAMSPKEG